MRPLPLLAGLWRLSCALYKPLCLAAPVSPVEAELVAGVHCPVLSCVPCDCCRERLAHFRELEFIPFNPTDKRTEATVETIRDRSVFKVTSASL